MSEKKTMPAVLFLPNGDKFFDVFLEKREDGLIGPPLSLKKFGLRLMLSGVSEGKAYYEIYRELL